MAETVPVLVVGGGIVGMSAALFLARQDVPCVLVERHDETAIYPRFRGLNLRTMELYRNADSSLEAALMAIGETDGDAGFLGKGRTLAGADTVWITEVGEHFPTRLSPSSMCMCDQDRVEPIVRRHAERMGAQVRYSTELMQLGQRPDGAVAVLRNRATGVESTIQAAYVIAADGANGSLRQRLQIGSHGPGHFQHRMAIYFRADLSAATRGRKVMACFIDGLGGHLVRRDEDKSLWQLSTPYDPARGEKVEDFTADRCLQLIRAAVGLPDQDAEVVAVLPWEIALRVADRYRAGRVFLAGDAAHVNGPWGGLGANTGIQDAHNLAWKLAAVHHGVAGDALLDTYDTERRPVADLVVSYAFGAMASDMTPGAPAAGVFEDSGPDLLGVALGYCYRSTAVSGGADDESAPWYPSLPDPAPIADPRVPSGRPGTRAPHVVLDRRGTPVSTIDLVGHGFVLLAGTEARWTHAVVREAREMGVIVSLYRIGPGGDLEDRDGGWARSYDLTPTGAVLVRPDGFLAWRSRSDEGDPVRGASEALMRLCARGTTAANSQHE